MNKIIRDDIAEIIKDTDLSKLNHSTILLSGPTGMLGKYILYTLLEIMERADLHLILIARNLDKVNACLGEYFTSPRIKIIISDLSEPFTIKEHIDYIIHVASLASPQFYETQPVDVIVPNIIGTYHLLMLAKQHQVKNFLFFSSSEIYGKISCDQNYNEAELGILDPHTIRNCYAESKRMGENLCVSFGKQYGLHTNAVRIYHTYGPTMDIIHDHRAFSEFVSCVVNGEDIIIKSDGKAKRPFCYISDATKAFFLILLKGKFGEVYNMCNDQDYISINDFAAILAEIRPDKGIAVIHGQRNPEDQYSVKQDENDVTADSTKLLTLGWKIKVDIHEGLERTVNSFLDDQTDISKCIPFKT